MTVTAKQILADIAQLAAPHTPARLAAIEAKYGPRPRTRSRYHVVTWPHPFIPTDGAGSQCGTPYCWGWRDDPRHWTAA